MFYKQTLYLLLLLVGITFGMSKHDKLPRDEFARRRAILLSELRELHAVAVFHSAPEVLRNHDVEYPYRQESNFFYLTGWTDMDAVLVLAPQDEDSNNPEVTLFVTERNPSREIWTGPRQGVDEAAILPGVDTVLIYTNFIKHSQKLIRGYDRLVVSYGQHKDFQPEFEKALEQNPMKPSIIQDASSLLKSHRLIKSEAEVLALEKAIEISGKSLTDALTKIPSLKYEYEVQAEIEYGFKKRGAVRLGFPSIVGAGKNSTFLHYSENRAELIQGDILLMDIGAEWDYYSADISRTVPISGKFSPEQAQIYQIVLDAQLAAIAIIKPGVTFREPHHIATEVITKGLVDLGLLKGDIETLVTTRAYRKYFMHGTSHWLGLDVHDAGGRMDEDGKPYKLKAGMVLTVEPGIYISESEDIDSKWWNIGIRIEDDILVTAKGHRVLSANIPKTISEIEAIMQP
jgi:Xaa-Pro aminopeptidase